ncbi:hypothetical protein HGM15179_002945, partial [Zosterops borbonicus]
KARSRSTLRVLSTTKIHENGFGGVGFNMSKQFLPRSPKVKSSVAQELLQPQPHLAFDKLQALTELSRLQTKGLQTRAGAKGIRMTSPSVVPFAGLLTGAPVAKG